MSLIDDGVCDCEFSPELADEGFESCLYLRLCAGCGCTWGGLHCPHDGAQNPCPECGVRPEPIVAGGVS